MTEKESIELISNMIHTAKKQINKADAFYYLLWGYLVVTASLAQYVMVTFMNLQAYAHWSWMLMVVGLFISIPYTIRSRRQRKVNTYTGRMVGYLWMGFGISMGVLLFASQNFGNFITPVILLLVAVCLFCTGFAFNFKPFIAGAIICWICAFIAFRYIGIEHLLINAFAITLGYIVPGHLIHAKRNV